jgi:sec-independent protein translocase protein TatB
MFNVTGGEIVIILVLALVVLGPEKLPEMIRKAGRLYGELRRMSSGFQSEFEEAFGEPLREFRETANQARDMIKNPLADHEPVVTPTEIKTDVVELNAAEAQANMAPVTSVRISGSEPPYAPVVSATTDADAVANTLAGSDAARAQEAAEPASPFAPPVGASLSAPAPRANPVRGQAASAPVPTQPVAPASPPASWGAPTVEPQANPWPSPEATS